MGIFFFSIEKGAFARDMGDALVSVVIPSRDRAEYVERAVNSVLAQTYPALEVIVVDDGSTKPLAPTLRQVFGDRIRCLRNEAPLGAPAARNVGWRQARGRFIAFLDDDDKWLPRKIEKQIGVFEEAKPDPALVFCGESLVVKDRVVHNLPAHWDDSSRERMLEVNVIGGTSTALVRREVLLAEDGFDQSLPACQDWDLWFRISRNNNIGFVPEILVHRAIHGRQISSNIQKRIAGREAFLRKHWQEISVEKNSLSQHLRRIGCLKVFVYGKRSGQKWFFSAIKISLSIKITGSA
jgi:glycosyltransferase involved in cell wall biosynthesis